jgi:hypothetical protein
MMKNTVLQVVFDNTDGVTVAKLARTAKIELTPVHHLRIETHKEVQVLKNECFNILADKERYQHGDVPVECRVEEEITNVLTFHHYWVDNTRVVLITKNPTKGLADETAFWKEMLADLSDEIKGHIAYHEYPPPESDSDDDLYAGSPGAYSDWDRPAVSLFPHWDYL